MPDDADGAVGDLGVVGLVKAISNIATGMLESRSLSGMNGLKAVSDTAPGNAAHSKSSLATGKRPSKRVRGEMRHARQQVAPRAKAEIA